MNLFPSLYEKFLTSKPNPERAGLYVAVSWQDGRPHDNSRTALDKYLAEMYDLDKLTVVITDETKDHQSSFDCVKFSIYLVGDNIHVIKTMEQYYDQSLTRVIVETNSLKSEFIQTIHCHNVIDLELLTLVFVAERAVYYTFESILNRFLITPRDNQ